MTRCLELARHGTGRVAPNPLVGAVIVLEDKILGEGYHQAYGGPHAEVNAIASVRDKSLLSKCTIYVSLEPCAHHGKTPPCADLLAKHSFNRAVIGCTDSFSEVSGKGIERLKSAGIDVTLGVLESKCREINRHFFTFHEKKRPYILLKWAQTPNNLIDNSEGSSGTVSWITAPETQVKVHGWRSQHQAILVGKNTVTEDNPSLTVRAVEGKNPIRIILDSNLSLDTSVTAMNNEAPTIVFNQVKSVVLETIKFIKVEKMNVQSILDAIYEEGIQSVLVEGGSATIQSFIDTGLWDETRIITGQQKFISGTSAPTLSGEIYKQEVFFKDQINYYWNQ
jgi:diaminohydroxyphosphoribosylaminopyrimidine deaminase/5-amino-6-(5-phosphoribosylamino)uracil reductase